MPDPEDGVVDVVVRVRSLFVEGPTNQGEFIVTQDEQNSLRKKAQPGRFRAKFEEDFAPPNGPRRRSDPAESR